MLKDLIQSFLPWILYFLLKGQTQLSIDIAVIVAAVTSVVFEIKALKKGFILSWGTLVFFVFLLISVVIFKNQWIVDHEWIFSNGTLALIAWTSIFFRQPFTLQYAKEKVEEKHWKHPLFIKINNILTSVWGIIFLLQLFVNFLQVHSLFYTEVLDNVISYGSCIIGVYFTNWFPGWYKEKYLRDKQRTNSYLSGNFAPVKDELTVADLSVIGEIPKELSGIYMRNGPNPAFPPIAYHYPFDGDGMIHAVYFSHGKASYRNRFVETRELLKERQAGKALYSSTLQPMPLDPKWADGDNSPQFKNGAFIHIIHHAGKYFAMSEGAPCYEMTADLKTLNLWQPKGFQKPIDVGPHTRLDPKTNELWFINYSLTPPYLIIYRVNAKSEVINTFSIDKPYSTMIHDFVLTENYVIIFDCPVVFDLESTSILNWKPELGVRVGIMEKDTGKISWHQTESFFVFHFANAYEGENEIIIDFVRHESLNIAMQKNNKPPMLYRTIFSLLDKNIKHIQLDDRAIEFPRIREDRNTFSHQFIYTLGRTSDIQNIQARNILIRYDVKSQKSEEHYFGVTAQIDEAIFLPKNNSQAENDGYVMLFCYDSKTMKSELVILDSLNISKEAIAKIQMPRRVPHGLHGSWITR